MNAYGSSFEWRHSDDPVQKGYATWSPFKNDSDYFGNPSQQYMVKYRVKNLEALGEELKKEGVTMVDEIENYEYGNLYIYRMEKVTGLNYGSHLIRNLKKL